MISTITWESIFSSLRDPSAIGSKSIGFEFALISLILFADFVRRVVRARKDNLFLVSRVSLSLLMFSLFALIVSYNQFCSFGRPILAAGMAMPGSALTRSLNIDVPPTLRRLVEPSLWFFICFLVVAAWDSRRKKTLFAFLISITALCLLLLVESWLLLPAIQQLFATTATLSPAAVFQYLLTQAVILPLLFGIVVELSIPLTKRDHRLVSFPLFKKCFLSGTAAIAAILGLFMAVDRLAKESRPLLVGAHYYSWFPENWVGGYIGEKLVPPVVPVLGKYISADSVVFTQHVKWARQAGINFFVFDWWPNRRGIRQRIEKQVAYPDLGGNFKYAMMFETLALKNPDDQVEVNEDSNVVFLTRQRTERLKVQLATLASRYMSDDNYLKIGGRPVLFIYASRHLVGPVAKAIEEARIYVKRTTGHELFLVGDEVFFNVLGYSKRDGILLRPEGIPEWDRIIAFDALTAYNPYNAENSEFAGASGAEDFLAAVEVLYRKYKTICATAGIPFIPGVIPGYNDRGVRLGEDHYVVPRRYRKNHEEKSFFRETVKRWGISMLDRDLPIFAVTSWNEWNEGTQIEPAAHSSETRQDSSQSGREYSLGEAYSGYALEHVMELRQVLEEYRAGLNPIRPPRMR